MCQVWICIGLSIPTVILSLFALSKYICALNKRMGSKQSKKILKTIFMYLITSSLSFSLKVWNLFKQNMNNFLRSDISITRHLVNSYNLRWILFEETISDSFSCGCLVFGLFRSRSSLQFYSDRFHHVAQY